jgi:hypothetical protein
MDRADLALAALPGDVAALAAWVREPCPQRREALLETICAAMLREAGVPRARFAGDAPPS